MPKSYKEEIKEKKRKEFISHTTRYTLLYIIFGTTIITLLFFANIFDVRAVKIDSPSSILESQIRENIDSTLDSRVLGLRRRSNSVIFSPQKLKKSLLRDFPRIDSMEIRRISLHEISVEITERSPVGLWCFPERQECFYYDVNGIAFAEVLPSSGFLFVPVNDYRSRSISLGDHVAPQEWRNNISEIKKILQFGSYVTSEVVIPVDSFHEFYVKVRDGWQILYSNEANIRRQTNSLLVFLKETITPSERSMLEYIDLRIDDRIYYKLKNGEE